MEVVVVAGLAAAAVVEVLASVLHNLHARFGLTPTTRVSSREGAAHLRPRLRAAMMTRR